MDWKKLLFWWSWEILLFERNKNQKSVCGIGAKSEFFKPQFRINRVVIAARVVTYPQFRVCSVELLYHASLGILWILTQQMHLHLLQSSSTVSIWMLRKKEQTWHCVRRFIVVFSPVNVCCCSGWEIVSNLTLCIWQRTCTGTWTPSEIYLVVRWRGKTGSHHQMKWKIWAFSCMSNTFKWQSFTKLEDDT